MTHAIRFSVNGGPEVLDWEAVDVPAPGAGEVSVQHTAVGLNFIDTYHRKGLYPVNLPSGLGVEAAGVITAVGSDVSGLAPGDRVAYAGDWVPTPRRAPCQPVGSSSCPTTSTTPRPRR